MSPEQRELKVRCWKCTKLFPVAAVTDPEEAERARPLLEKGEGSLRVARWCPWCRENNMVEVPIEWVRVIVTPRALEGLLSGEEAVLGTSAILAGQKPKEGEETHRDRRR